VAALDVVDRAAKIEVQRFAGLGVEYLDGARSAGVGRALHLEGDRREGAPGDTHAAREGDERGVADGFRHPGRVSPG